MHDDWVYVVDDDPDLRRSLEDLISVRGPWNVRSFPDGSAWLAAAQNVALGCVLLDLNMPNTTGLTVLERMRERGLLHQVIVLTGEANVAAAVAAMRGGAVDFLEKPIEFPALQKSLHAAFELLRDRAEGARRQQEAASLLGRLSPRERDVMMCLIEGLPNKIIAYRLGLSTRTVEVHRANLMEKTGLQSLADLLKVAFTAGIEFRPVPPSA